jgi:hypothetical protein
VAWAGVSCMMVDASPGAAGVLGVLAKDSGAGARSGGGAPSPDVRDACDDVVSRNVAAAAAAVEPVPFVLTGGHSRAMRCSSFMASLALLEVALAARDDGPGGVG